MLDSFALGAGNVVKVARYPNSHLSYDVSESTIFATYSLIRSMECAIGRPRPR
jgi:hypothetical protein